MQPFERRPECMEKRMARFLQGDRPEAGAKLAMAGSGVSQ